ncbi:hypothetical protein AB0B56_14205 [Streptosporangium canum]|uniref:hypothetical protein n=1 Tax=Streptosporangium canum TaxID=324952 RepID=UPI00341460B1
MTMIVSLAAAPSWAQQEPAPTSAPTRPTPAPKGGMPVVNKAVEAAKKKAHTTGKRVEIPSQQTESTTVFANPDGKTLRMELHAQPIRIKKAKGDGFTPIDTTLIEDNGVIKPKAIKGELTLSAGQGPVLLKRKTAQGTAEIAAPDKLPKPKLTGSTATYPSAYGEGVDLVVTATATGFRQKIVIREQPSGPVTFRLPIDLPKGVSYGKSESGQPRYWPRTARRSPTSHGRWCWTPSPPPRTGRSTLAKSARRRSVWSRTAPPCCLPPTRRSWPTPRSPTR